jgi:hypothetical protein
MGARVILLHFWGQEMGYRDPSLVLTCDGAIFGFLFLLVIGITGSFGSRSATIAPMALRIASISWMVWALAVALGTLCGLAGYALKDRGIDFLAKTLLVAAPPAIFIFTLGYALVIATLAILAGARQKPN